MNLYKIIFSHTAPKDSKVGLVCLLLGENDEQVYEWIKSDPEINGSSLYHYWKDHEEDGEEFDIYDENYDIIGTETFKEKMVRIKGEINDEDYDYSDAYYGITLYGWSLLKENVDTDYSELKELGILYSA